MVTKIPKHCYLHPHIEKRWINDKIGYGLFAVKPITKGEITTICAGCTISKAKIANATPRIINLIETYGYDLDEDLLLYPDEKEPMHDVWFLNHSCDPSVGNLDLFSTVAMRDIKIGEQITIDYATVDTDEIQEHPGMQCFCKAKNCRKTITGDDWMLPELWKRYGIENFQPHIQRKINALKQIPG